MSAPPTAPPDRRLRDERGFMLIEVLVSAVILVTASLAIFSTLSQADTASGNQANRVEASNYAQSELERIRSLPVEDIMDFAKAGTHTSMRGGTKFTETVVAKWVSDGGDEPECTGQEGGLDYLRTTVTIAWDNMGQARPISLTSLYTPSAGAGGTTGSVSVHIINRDGGPDSGITVNLAGQNTGGTPSGTTNQNGCVVFGFIPQDKYSLTFSAAGWVDQDSNNVVTDTVTVTAGETSKVEYDYDQGGWTKAKFQTSVGIGLFGLLNPPLLTPNVATYPQHFQLWNIGQTAPGGFDVDLPGNLTGTTSGNAYGTPSRTTAWDGSNPVVPLYPFSDSYSVYAGTCPDNIPNSPNGVNIPRANYQNTGNVDVPALGVKVTDGNSVSVPGAVVGGARVTIEFGCSGSKWTRTTATALGTNTAAGQSPWGIGTLGDPGFPYVKPGGTTAVIRYCAYAPPSPGYQYGRFSTIFTSTQGNANFTSGTPLPIYLTASGWKPGTAVTAPNPATATCM